MIYYICTAHHADTVGVLLSYYGPALDNEMRVLPYAKVELLAPCAGDVVIWTDFDRLSDGEVAGAAAVSDRIEAADGPVLQLNHPRRSLRRFDLLRDLYRSGANPFNVFRFDEAVPTMRFPVFIRKERGVSRHAPTLLNDWPALQAAMADHVKRGGDTSDLMIVELSVQRGPDGRFRKYGIFRMGDDIFPQDCVVNDHWYIKYASRQRDEVAQQENQQYLAANPHAELVRPLFEAANIEFGRMDYAMIDDRVQVFEINTNPTFVTQPPSRYDSFDRAARARHYQKAFHRLQLAGLAQADSGVGSETSSSPQIDAAHEALMAEVRRKADRRHHRRQALGFLAALGRPVKRMLTGRR